METVQAYYLTKMREGLSLKQRNNPHYSLRAYARDIGIHPATLSQIINGKRPLPVKDSENVIKKLNLAPKEKAMFLDSLHRRTSSLSRIKVSEDHDRLLLDESYYKIIAEWEHFAVLELFHIREFKRTREDIAQRLDLTLNRADVVINNLVTCGLMETDNEGRLVKVHSDVKTADDISSQALRESHRETLEIAATKIDNIPVELRDFSSLTLAIDIQKIPDAKRIIREFRQKMMALFSEGERTEVYEVAIQLFPVTPVKKTLH